MSRLLPLGIIGAAFCSVLWTQTMLDGTAAQTILGASAAATSRSFPCQVSAIKPFLNIGLRLQTGYILRIPPGSGRSFTVLFAVSPEGGGNPVHLIDHVVRAESDSGKSYESIGTFFVGPGRYHVKWLVFDDATRGCSKEWNIEANGSGKSKLAIEAGAVSDVASTRVATRSTARSKRRMTVLLDAAPISVSGSGRRLPGAPFLQRSGRGGGDWTLPSSLEPDHVGSRVIGTRDQVLLLGALATLLEQLPADQVRLAAYNLAYQKELYRNDSFRWDAFSELAHAIGTIEEAGVDYRTLLNRTGHIDLLAGLINRETRATPPSDLVVFLGPTEPFHNDFPEGRLAKRRSSSPRFFFLRYELSYATQYSGLNSAAVGGGDISDSVQDIARSGGLVMSAAPGGMPDTLSQAIKRLNGKTIPFTTPDQFAKAISVIDRPSRSR